LNLNFPDIYKDDNHKPEMAIAVTDFEALCGFKSPLNMHDTISKIPPLNKALEAVDISKLLDQ